MNLVIADPTLNRRASGSASWFRYLVPELQTFWVTPQLFAHAACDPEMEPLLVRSEYGQQEPAPLNIKRLFRHDCRSFPKEAGFKARQEFQTFAEETEADFGRLSSVTAADCVYVKDAALPHVHAAIRWMNHFPAKARPRMILHVDGDGLSEYVPGEKDPGFFDWCGSAIRSQLNKEAGTYLKIVALDPRTARWLEGLFDYEVDTWPGPQFSRTSRQVRPAGRLVAVLGNQAPEKGAAMLPELAAWLLGTYPDIAVLIHNASDKPLHREAELRALEGVNKRLVLMRGAVPFDRWQAILSAVDLALLPYDSRFFRSRGSWLLDELIACGVPALVPRDTELEARIHAFGIAPQTFDEATPEAICDAAGRAFADWADTFQAAEQARNHWNETQGAKRLALKVLSWFPAVRPQWTGWSDPAPLHSPSLVRAGHNRAAAHRKKRILLTWPGDPRYIPPPVLSDRQITVGAHPLATRDTGVCPNQHRPFDAYAPFLHTYDLAEVLALQGITGPFDLVVVATDATFGNVPMNVKALGCPAVLYAGDTHWGQNPIQRMVDYSLAAAFDFVLTTYNRQHLHWYAEAGHKQVAWIPGLAVEHFDQPFPQEKKKQIAFAGLTQQTHNRRGRLLASLRAAGFPLKSQSLSRAEAGLLYGGSAVSFNASLNGDLNLRTFEVMSAGGCLVADRLSPESGQSVLFEEGRDYLGYACEEELLQVTNRCLNDAVFAQNIARYAHQSYRNGFRPEQQSAALLNWVFEGTLDAKYAATGDQRPRLSAIEPVTLNTRIAVYQQLQECHRVNENPRVLIGPSVPIAIVADMLDLPRLSCFAVEAKASMEPVLERHGLGGRVSYVDSWAQAKTSTDWDLAICARGENQLPPDFPCKQAITVEAASAVLSRCR